MPDHPERGRARTFLYLVRASKAKLDAVLREAVAPFARAATAAEVVYFHRSVKPDWNLRLAVRGGEEVCEASVTTRLAGAMAPLVKSGTVVSWEPADPDPELEGLGFESSSIEALFHHDTAACLELLALEAAGPAPRSRREFSMVLTERLLDVLGLAREERLAFYRRAYRLPLEQGTWTDADRPLLEERYRALRQGLAVLLDPGRDHELVWGGVERASVAERCLESMRPHLEALRRADAAGTLPRELVPLASELVRRHTNRLGIDGLGEAVMRYLACRLHEEGRVVLS